ncbi:hypothetical protein [Actinoplanes regularis]|uniref:Uncharacterized protein n=1 Tax=Actinoplanes regularis TaxID=52697 RepID=A0A239JJ04_9ACTN|nr:hypothetical protein [Actinoplanes regularis]SNT04724.1 hypothetical protein SAMN06264365_13518 [Actinoplanes regularis]
MWATAEEPIGEAADEIDRLRLQRTRNPLDELGFDAEMVNEGDVDHPLPSS